MVMTVLTWLIGSLGNQVQIVSPEERWRFLLLKKEKAEPAVSKQFLLWEQKVAELSLCVLLDFQQVLHREFEHQKSLQQPQSGHLHLGLEVLGQGNLGQGEDSLWEVSESDRSNTGVFPPQLVSCEFYKSHYTAGLNSSWV